MLKHRAWLQDRQSTDEKRDDVQEVARLEPETWHASVAPRRRNLTLLVLPPDRVEPVGDVVRDETSDRLAHRRVACRTDNDVGGKLGAVGEENARLGEFGNLLALLDLDLAVDDELAASDVDIVTSSLGACQRCSCTLERLTSRKYLMKRPAA